MVDLSIGKIYKIRWKDYSRFSNNHHPKFIGELIEIKENMLILKLIRDYSKYTSYFNRGDKYKFFYDELFSIEELSKLDAIGEVL